MITPLAIPSDFCSRHPLRIDLGDGTHLRFRDLMGAAKTAIDRRCNIWDETHGKPISLLDCKLIVNSA